MDDTGENIAESTHLPEELLINGKLISSKDQSLSQSFDNRIYNSIHATSDTNDQLSQMVIELEFQNDYLKAQFEGLKTHLSCPTKTCGQEEESRDEPGSSEKIEDLHEKIKSLLKEIEEQKETQKAAENALKHLQVSYSEADIRVRELSLELNEVKQKMEREVKERDDKYVELDTKFGRLHKRAKQRIQELQKEKDDLEVRFNEVNKLAEQASLQQSSLQQDLERTRQQANEALRAMDAERQQLRTSNNKFRESIEEMRHSLEAKEGALDVLQQSVYEKEQIIEDMRDSLQCMEDKRQTSISELATKHQKIMESLEAQLSDALADRSKAAETITSLQTLIAEKESEVAELETAATGEAVRLRAAAEEAKGEVIHLKHEHEKEKESWESAYQGLKAKLEISESACLRTEIESATMRSQLEHELSVQSQLLNTKEAELIAAREEIKRLETEFSSYKVRAHALLQKKEVELLAAKDNDIIKAKDEAVKEAEKEALLALAERDKALQDLQNISANYDKELAARDAALSDAEHQIKNIKSKMALADAHYTSEKEAWQRNFENLQETWRLKYEALEAQNNACVNQEWPRELEEVRLQYKKLKDEHDSFRDIADRMIEEKDKEIAKLLDDNKNLLQISQLNSLVQSVQQFTATLF